LDKAIPRRFFNFYLVSRPKTGAPNLHVEACGNPVLGCDMTLRPAASKVHQNFETTKAKKDDTNIHVLYWGGPFGSPKSNTFQSPKTGIKQIEQFDARTPHKMRKML